MKLLLAVTAAVTLTLQPHIAAFVSAQSCGVNGNVVPAPACSTTFSTSYAVAAASSPYNLLKTAAPTTTATSTLQPTDLTVRPDDVDGYDVNVTLTVSPSSLVNDQCVFAATLTSTSSSSSSLTTTVGTNVGVALWWSSADQHQPPAYSLIGFTYDYPWTSASGGGSMTNGGNGGRNFLLRFTGSYSTSTPMILRFKMWTNSPTTTVAMSNLAITCGAVTATTHSLAALTQCGTGDSAYLSSTAAYASCRTCCDGYFMPFQSTLPQCFACPSGMVNGATGRMHEACFGKSNVNAGAAGDGSACANNMIAVRSNGAGWSANTATHMAAFATLLSLLFVFLTQLLE